MSDFMIYMHNKISQMKHEKKKKTYHGTEVSQDILADTNQQLIAGQ